LDLYFVREHVVKGELEVNHIPSTYQVADILTKPLSKLNFIRLREKLQVKNLQDNRTSSAERATTETAVLNSDSAPAEQDSIETAAQSQDSNFHFKNQSHADKPTKD
jgi:hypothetical protein